MSIYKLKAKQNSDRKVELRCPVCDGLAEEQRGAVNRDQMPYVLSCSRCQTILGEWPTRQEMRLDLDAIVARCE